MSNFGSFGQVNGGLPGTAPNIFIASTVDNFGTLTATGYLNDISVRVKANDIFYINYSDTSVFPLGEVSEVDEFYVVVSGSDYSLSPLLTATGQAAAKDVTNNALPLVASVSGSFVVDNFISAHGTNGTTKDSGFGTNNVVRYAQVAISAAEFNGMYGAPKLLVAAAGANTLILLDRAYLEMTYGTTGFLFGGAVDIQYDSTVHAGGFTASNSIAAATFTGAAASFSNLFLGAMTAGSFALTVNKGLYLSNATAAFTTGDSTFVMHVWYRIVATA